MKIKFVLLITLLTAFLYLSCNKENQEDSSADETFTKQDSIYFSMLINHLRKNFDDIHDVSMRFHHLDHTLNGLIVFKMTWENKKMQSASVVENETGNNKFAEAFIEKIQSWNINELDGPLDANLPLRIRIVGSSDSTFAEKAILTGKVIEVNDQPIEGAEISFTSTKDEQQFLRACYSNREGIYVRTLIPVGNWKLHCSKEGYKDIVKDQYNFESGVHHRESFKLIRVK